MGHNLRLLQEFSLKAKSLHELAKAYWGDFVISSASEYIENEILIEETARLIAHRKSVVSIISETFRYSLPSILRNELVNAVLLIQRGYSEALVCTDLYRSEIKLMTTFPLLRGPYAAKNFILPSGCFDELNWAKRFVSDEYQSVYRRFELACLYCFEDIIRNLWIFMNRNGTHPYEGSFSNVENIYGTMVFIWCQHLEDVYGEPTEFYSQGFVEASDKGFEHASRFFWDACPDTEKDQLMREMEDYDMADEYFFSDPNQFKNHGYVNFFYSLLSPQQKRNIISLTAPIGAHFMWSCLLLSRFNEYVLRDILTIPFPKSSLTYAHLIREVTNKMVELPIPDYAEIFKVLWNPLSGTQQRRIIGMDFNIILNLTKIKRMDLLEEIIPPLPDDDKESMLVHDWQCAGMTALLEFLKVEDYDGLQKYLILFLVDRDRVTGEWRVRFGAIDFFNRFLSVNNFPLWTNESVPEHVINETNKVIESIRVSLISYFHQVK